LSSEGERRGGGKANAQLLEESVSVSPRPPAVKPKKRKGAGTVSRWDDTRFSGFLWEKKQGKEGRYRRGTNLRRVAYYLHSAKR